MADLRLIEPRPKVSKEALLTLIDELRQDVEEGNVLGIAASVLYTNRGTRYLWESGETITLAGAVAVMTHAILRTVDEEL